MYGNGWLWYHSFDYDIIVWYMISYNLKIPWYLMLNHCRCHMWIAIKRFHSATAARSLAAASQNTKKRTKCSMMMQGLEPWSAHCWAVNLTAEPMAHWVIIWTDNEYYIHYFHECQACGCLHCRSPMPTSAPSNMISQKIKYYITYGIIIWYHIWQVVMS